MNSQELTAAQSPEVLPLKVWLDVLSAAFPPRGTLVVGAGNGTGPFVQWLARRGTSAVWLIEGDETQYQYLRRHVLANTDWVVRREIVASTPEPTSFHRASNPAESGLIAPEELRTLWPHLATVHVDHEVTPVTVDQLWEESGRLFNWLVLDCLPAAMLAQGASEALGQADVVILRAITDERKDALSNAKLSAVAPLLQSAGFRCALSHPQRHPFLAHVIYLRDIAQQTQALSAARADVERACGDAVDARARLEQELKQLTAQLEHEKSAHAEEKEELEKRATQQRSELDSLRQLIAETASNAHEQSQAHVALITQLKDALNAAEREISSLSQAREDQRRLAEERAIEIASLAQECNGQTKLITECKHRISQLEAEQGELKAKLAEAEVAAGKTREKDGIDALISDLMPFMHERAITYVDAGACLGEVFLKFYHQKGITLREAHLFEPNPDNYASLMKKIATCNTQSLHAYRLALGDSRAPKQFSKARTMTKAVESAVRIDDETATNFFNVECVTLDEFARSFTERRIDILKIDVEGSEIAVLKGAHELLSEQRIDIIYIEVGFNVVGTQQVYFGEIDSLMQSYRYRIFRIYEQTNEWMQDSPLLRRCNVAYFSERFAESNPYRLSRELLQLRNQLAQIGRPR